MFGLKSFLKQRSTAIVLVGTAAAIISFGISRSGKKYTDAANDFKNQAKSIPVVNPPKTERESLIQPHEFDKFCADNKEYTEYQAQIDKLEKRANDMTASAESRKTAANLLLALTLSCAAIVPKYAFMEQSVRKK